MAKESEYVVPGKGGEADKVLGQRDDGGVHVHAGCRSHLGANDYLIREKVRDDQAGEHGATLSSFLSDGKRTHRCSASPLEGPNTP